jgi:hypothetical protein
MASRANGKSCNYIRIYVTPQVILKEGMHNIKLNFTSSSEAEYGTPTLAYYPPRPAWIFKSLHQNMVSPLWHITQHEYSKVYIKIWYPHFDTLPSMNIQKFTSKYGTLLWHITHDQHAQNE